MNLKYITDKRLFPHVAILFLIFISVFSYLGLQNTILTGKNILFLDEESSLTAYMNLYVVLTAAQYAAVFIPVFFISGWFKEAIVFIVAGMILISGLGALENVQSDPFKFLEPVKYHHQKTESIKTLV